MVGDRVIHIAGTDYFDVIRPKKDTKTCIVCGTENPSSNTDCQICAHQLLDYAE